MCTFLEFLRLRLWRLAFVWSLFVVFFQPVSPGHFTYLFLLPAISSKSQLQATCKSSSSYLQVICESLHISISRMYVTENLTKTVQVWVSIYYATFHCELLYPVVGFCKGAFKKYVDKILDFFNPPSPPGGQFYLIGPIK